MDDFVDTQVNELDRTIGEQAATTEEYIDGLEQAIDLLSVYLSAAKQMYESGKEE